MSQVHRRSRDARRLRLWDDDLDGQRPHRLRMQLEPYHHKPHHLYVAVVLLAEIDRDAALESEVA